MVMSRHSFLYLDNRPESEFDCEIQDLLRSTFLKSSGSTSTWSVVTTSQPSKAIPGEKHNFVIGRAAEHHQDSDSISEGNSIHLTKPS